MEDYFAAAWIVGGIVFLWFIIGALGDRTASKATPYSVIVGLALATLWSAMAGIFWPLTVIAWISSYKSPNKKQAEIAKQEEQRLDFQCAQQQEVRDREEALAAQKRAAEQRARELWARYFSMFDGRHASEMSGSEFERFVGKLYTHLGYEVSLTDRGADQGADLILRKDGHKIAVQAKRWTKSVGNAAVQEVIAGKLFYGCSHGIIVTTSTFSGSAVALAAKDPTISLVDGQALSKLCRSLEDRPAPAIFMGRVEKN
jgi:restriction system protein